jgi:hypothetical protein
LHSFLKLAFFSPSRFWKIHSISMTGEENLQNYGQQHHHLPPVSPWSATDPPLSPWESDFSFSHQTGTDLSYRNPYLPEDPLNLHHHHHHHHAAANGTAAVSAGPPLYPVTTTASSATYSPTSPSSVPSPSASYPFPSSVAGPSSGNDEPEGEFTGAIEEDKRRRNTAASARFRLKKKEREADLEKKTKDMSSRCDELHKRIGALETENRWLRELITERSRNRNTKRKGPMTKVFDMLKEQQAKGTLGKKKIDLPLDDEDEEEEVES